MDLKTYTDQVAKQHSALSDYIAANVGAISLPTAKNELQVGKKNFLTISGWVFNVIGILAFIIGLIVGVGGIWITGCAGLTAGIYLLIKGKQQLVQEAYNGVGTSLVAGVDKVVAHVSEQWTEFVNGQNNDLRRDILTSDLDTDGKVKALGYITDASYLHVDRVGMQEDVKQIDAFEDLKRYHLYLPWTEKLVKSSLDLAAKAQTDVFVEIQGPMPEPAKAAAPAAPKAPAAPAAPKAPEAPAAPEAPQPTAPTK